MSVGQADWLPYLGQICSMLWPPPATVALYPGSGWRRGQGAALARRRHRYPEGSELVLLRWPSRTHLLVPATPRAGAAAVRHYGLPSSRLRRLSARAISLALATGFAAGALYGRARVAAPPDSDTIETYLSGVLQCELRVGLYVGPPRANRKPVLQLLSPAGGPPLGFAKIGINPLTRDLLRVERESLDLLGQVRFAEVTVPRVLSYGSWRDVDVLVLSALPIWSRRRPVSAARLTVGVAEIARVGGLRRHPLAESSYPERLRGRLASADEGPERAALLEALDALVQRAGSTALTFGAWHGDLSPWNMAGTDHGLLVWDWERFGLGVPLGFDLLHHWLQNEVGPKGREPQGAAADCVRLAAQLLAPLEVAPGEAQLTALLYLVDLAARYLADRQAEAGAPRGAPGTWLIPVIALAVAQV